MNGKTCNCEHDNIKAFRTLGEISRPAEKLVFIDASSRERWIDGSFSPIRDIEAQEPQWPLTQTSHNITARHGEGCNISLADLHCEYWKWKDRRTVKLANWEIAPQDASIGNLDLERMVGLLKGVGQ
jgi:prepilin-type processing-associated H-X9-DG protein